MEYAKVRGFEPVSDEGVKLAPIIIKSFMQKGFGGKVYCNGNYKEPRAKTYKSAGSDIYYTGNIPLTINPNEKIAIITNVKAYMQDNEMLMADVRSSQGTFDDLMLCNTLGIIDEDYYNNSSNEGNIILCLKNMGVKPVVINRDSAIAQLIFVPCLKSDNPCEQKIREDGFGSTTV